MILLSEYFIPSNEERHREYLYCIESNSKNPNIEIIELFIESDNDKLPFESNKVNYNFVNERPTFSYLFEFCNEKYKGEICIISNLDIIFDQTLKHINNSNISNKFITLNRYDIKEDGKLYPFRHNIGDSQDCWIFKSPININGADFTMGRLGCDNKIAYLAYESGMNVINPRGQIITRHLHNVEFRTISEDSENTVWGMHLLVLASKDINTPSLLYKRNWQKV